MPRDLGPHQVIVTDGSVLIHKAPRRREPNRVQPPAEEPENQAALEPQAFAADQNITPEVVEAAPAAEVEYEPASKPRAFSGSGGEYDHRSAGISMEIGAPEAGALERVYGEEFREEESRGDESRGDGARGADTLVLDSFVVPGGARTVTRSRNNVPPPPLGWGIEFGTGRLVPIHSFKGRMSYGDHS